MKKYDSDVPEGHAFVEKRIFHVDDLKLRRNGFRIEHRPNTGPAIWSKGSNTYTQPEAERMCE